MITDWPTINDMIDNNGMMTVDMIDAFIEYSIIRKCDITKSTSKRVYLQKRTVCRTGTNTTWKVID